MNPRAVSRTLIVLTVLYGTTIAVLGVLDVTWMSTFAAIGGIVLGGMWALTGVAGWRSRGDGRDRGRKPDR